MTLDNPLVPRFRVVGRFAFVREREDTRRFAIAVVWVIAFGAAFVEGATWFGSLHVRLTVAGGLLEVLGILLLAADLLGDRAGRWVSTLAATTSRVWRSVARRVTGQRRSIAFAVPSISARAEIFTPTIRLTPGSADEELQKLRSELEALRDRVADVEHRHEHDLVVMREETRRTVRQAITESKGDLFEWRIAGLAIALIGSIVLSIANLV